MIMDTQVSTAKKTRTIATGTVKDVLAQLNFTPNPIINDDGEISVTGKEGAEWFSLASNKQTSTIALENGERRSVSLCVSKGFDMSNLADAVTTAEEVLEARQVTHEDGSTATYRNVVIYVGNRGTVEVAESLF